MKLEWDAAISFVDKDVDKAKEVARLLGDRAKVFVYANHPERLVGGDGVETFSGVYGREAKLVVVLYRSTWGATSWTGIEKTAINSRRLNERTDEFLMVVKMEDVETPPWLAASRIFGQWEPLGAKGVAGAIVSRLQQLGKQVRPETPGDVARRLAAANAWRLHRDQLLSGPSGFEIAQTETARVFDEMQRLAADAECAFKRANDRAAVLRSGYFSVVATTSKKGVRALAMTLWEGEFWGLNMNSGSELDRELLTLDIEPPDIVGWRESPAVFMTSEKVAETAIMNLLKRVERDN
jgi:hypothetical protein